MKRTLLALALSFSAAFGIPDGTSILRQLDSQQKLGVDFTAKVKMLQQKAGQSPRSLSCLYYRRDVDDSFLVVMLEPEVEKGNGYLRVKDSFWMYRQNTRSFQHVNRDENIGSSDMRGGDFESRKTSDLYSPVTNAGKEAVEETTLGKVPVYRIEIVAKVSDVTYPKQILWITRDNFLPLKIQNFSLSGQLMQTQYMKKYTQIQGRFVPVTGLTVDEFEKGNKTAFEISDVSMAPIESRVFTKPYLESLSR